MFIGSLVTARRSHFDCERKARARRDLFRFHARRKIARAARIHRENPVVLTAEPRRSTTARI